MAATLLLLLMTSYYRTIFLFRGSRSRGKMSVVTWNLPLTPVGLVMEVGARVQSTKQLKRKKQQPHYTFSSNLDIT